MSESALLTIDIGNSNVCLGVFDYGQDKPQLTDQWRLSSRPDQTSDEVAALLRALFDNAEMDRRRITAVILSSVVPPLVPIWERASTKLFARPPMLVGPGIRTGMPIRYENPREVGADRIVNAVAALELVGGPVIAVDFGTATTFDCVSRDGAYQGGAIFPGILISIEALFERAAMLHRVEVARPKSVIGKTTTQSLQSGLLYGYAGMVDAMVERIRGELGSEARVVATGGLAHRIAAESRTIERVEPFLTLEGLRLLFEKNRPQRGIRPPGEESS